MLMLGRGKKPLLFRRILLGVSGLVVGAIVVMAGMWRTVFDEPSPPVPSTLQQTDVLVRQQVNEAVETVKHDPHNAQRWLKLAQVYYANDFLEQARPCYNHVLAEQPNHARAWYGLALLERADGRSDRAFDAIDNALASNDTYAPARWRRAMWALDQGDLKEAERAIKRVRQSDLNSRNAVLVQARFDLMCGRASDVVAWLEPYVKTNHDDGFAHQLLGRAYRRLGRTDEATIAMARGRHAQRSLTDPWRREIMDRKTGLVPERKRADELFAQQKYEQSIARYEQLREQFPRNPTLATNLALAYANTGRLNKALKVLDDIAPHVTSSVDRARVAFRIGDVYLRQNAYRRALQAADHAIESHPALGVAHRLRAVALLELGRHDEAMRALNRAVHHSQDDATPAFHRGRLQASLGDVERAIESFRIAVERDPLLLDGWLSLAEAHAGQRAFERAEHALAMAQRVNPNAQQLARAQQRLNALKQRDDTTQTATGTEANAPQ